MSLSPSNPEEVQAAVLSAARLQCRGGGSKPALAGDGAATLEMGGVAGVVQYLPAEYTVTALAGTTVAEIAQLLARNGQYLPFDPLLAERGATLGGTVAAGAAGPGRYRYGGVRDFILEVKLVDGRGRLVRGGGKVVKNAAGFDLPKLMVGSLGRLGVLVELTFKVFPRPPARATLRTAAEDLEAALELLVKLTVSPIELECLDLEPPATLWLRLAGPEEALSGRLEKLEKLVGAGEVRRGADDEELWRDVRELRWTPPGAAVIKVPTTPSGIRKLEEWLGERPCPRRYSCGGQQAWLAWPAAGEGPDRLLGSLGLAGLRLTGPPGEPLIGKTCVGPFLERVKSALDPDHRFPDFGAQKRASSDPG